MSRRLFFTLVILFVGCFVALSLFLDPAIVRAGKMAIDNLANRVADVFIAVARWQERRYTLSIIVYTVLALIIAHALLPRLAKTGASFWSFRKKVRAAKELKGDEEQLIKQLVELYEDIGKELKLLQEIGRHRSLYPDERYLRAKLSHYQKALKALMPQKRERSSR